MFKFDVLEEGGLCAVSLPALLNAAVELSGNLAGRSAHPFTFLILLPFFHLGGTTEYPDTVVLGFQALLLLCGLVQVREQQTVFLDEPMVLPLVELQFLLPARETLPPRHPWRGRLRGGDDGDCGVSVGFWGFLLLHL
jgi:hypothetical protein